MVLKELIKVTTAKRMARKQQQKGNVPVATAMANTTEAVATHKVVTLVVPEVTGAHTTDVEKSHLY